MPSDLVVRCPNTECPAHQKPIALLAANPERIIADPEGWPKDGTVRWIACPECRRVSAYSHARIEPHLPDYRSTRKEWIGVTLVCGEEGCKSQSRFHALLAERADKELATEIQAKVAGGYWIGRFPDCRHTLSSASHVVFDRVSLFEPRD
jgi:hypothetical protein